MDFEHLVELYYGPLFRFAVSLTHTEADAGDLTQETFRTWALRGDQLRDSTRVKAWLFTTLYRQFLKARRRQDRFSSVELDETSAELPSVEPAGVSGLDSQAVTALLNRVDGRYRASVALFYLEDYAYQEITEILGIPLGTVKSRIARGLGQLQRLLAAEINANNSRTEGKR